MSADTITLTPDEYDRLLAARAVALKDVEKALIDRGWLQNGVLSNIRALATTDSTAALDRVIRAAKAEGMREAAGMLQEHFGVPLRPEAAWSDAEKAAYDKGQQEASDLKAERILAAAEKLHRKPGEISFGCCCVGPINGEPECPCKMRARRVKPNP